MSEIRTLGPLQHAAQHALPEPAARASILMVDDQPGRLLSYEAILSDLAPCVRALSGKEALQKLLQQEFAAILLDVNMPEMDGFEVARLIREHPRIERTPIVFVTAESTGELDRLRGYEVGAIDYVSVPVVPEILRSKVAVLLELHQRRRELQALNQELVDARARAEAQHAAVAAERETLLRATFEHPTELMLLLEAERGADGAIVDWIYRNANTNSLKLLGRTRDTLLGQRLSEVLPERFGRVHETCAAVLTTREPMRYESAFDGRDFLITIFPLGEGSVVSSGIDITERKRTITALHESRERLLQAKAAARLGTYDCDVRAGTLEVDELAHEIWGSGPASTVTYQEFLAGVHAEDRASVEAAIRRALDPAGPGDYRACYRVVHRHSGETRWVDATGKVSFAHERAQRMVGTVLDVTARMAAQESLRASEERFRELANTIDQLVWICDSSGRRSWYNDRWYRYSGTTFAEMQDFGWQALHHPEHLPRVLAHLHACLRTGEPWEDTFPLRDKDGAYRWFLSRAVPIHDEHGKIVRWLGTNTDITEQRELHEALQQADRRKDEFLAMLAHELRNPVAPIANAAEVLARLPGDDKQRALVAIVQRQTANLSRLLDDLLDVARVTQGRIALRPEAIALDLCLDIALETTAPLLRERRHRVTVSRATPAPTLHADKVRMAQCLANLINNAAKYTEPGGEIRIVTTLEQGFAAVAVSDTGMGIAPEFLPRIFDLFAQSERGLDRAQGGLGIGLSICKRLVEMHGGTIAANSPGLGRGATFVVRLPLLDAADVRSGAPRVLIVDDNDDAAQSLALLLDLDGHRTLTVNSGAKALEAFATFAPQFVLLDIGLPDIDGYTVAQRLRELAPQVRLIAVSGHGMAEDRERSAAAGFDAHLVKPLDPAALKRLLG